MVKRLLLFLIIVFGLIQSNRTLAQADYGMSTHWYNRSGYNPAFIVRSEYLYLFTNVRQQWVGIEGAPTSMNLQASSYVHNLRSAFGLSFVADKIGATQAYNPMLTYAFLLSNNSEWALSMGLSGGVFYRTINSSMFEADVINDPAIDNLKEEVSEPDANIGLELHTKRFIFGLSSTHLFGNSKADDYYIYSNHRYAYAIYKNNNSDNFYYKLGVQVINRGTVTVVEGNAFIRLKHATGMMKGPREIFDFGVSVRSSRQLALMIGVLVSPNIRVGYAYDQSFIDEYYTNGSHEIMLEYRIPNKAASTRLCGR